MDNHLRLRLERKFEVKDEERGEGGVGEASLPAGQFELLIFG